MLTCECLKNIHHIIQGESSRQIMSESSSIQTTLSVTESTLTETRAAGRMSRLNAKVTKSRHIKSRPKSHIVLTTEIPQHEQVDYALIFIIPVGLILLAICVSIWLVHNAKDDKVSDILVLFLVHCRTETFDRIQAF